MQGRINPALVLQFERHEWSPNLPDVWGGIEFSGSMWQEIRETQQQLRADFEKDSQINRPYPTKELQGDVAGTVLVSEEIREGARLDYATSDVLPARARLKAIPLATPDAVRATKLTRLKVEKLVLEVNPYGFEVTAVVQQQTKRRQTEKTDYIKTGEVAGRNTAPNNGETAKGRKIAEFTKVAERLLPSGGGWIGEDFSYFCKKVSSAL